MKSLAGIVVKSEMESALLDKILERLRVPSKFLGDTEVSVFAHHRVPQQTVEVAEPCDRNHPL